MNKWRNKGLWVALVSTLLLATQAIGTIFGFEVTDETISKVMVAVNSVLSVLVVAGVVSNPSQGSGFKDSE
jgi:phi LC3 family holin